MKVSAILSIVSVMALFSAGAEAKVECKLEFPNCPAANNPECEIKLHADESKKLTKEEVLKLIQEESKEVPEHCFKDCKEITLNCSGELPSSKEEAGEKTEPASEEKTEGESKKEMKAE
jgi:hypothetical protein